MSVVAQKMSPKGCLGDNRAQGRNGYRRYLQETGMTPAAT